jgi:hypothetical protein
MAIKPPMKYNFYHPDFINPHGAHKQGIVGYTNEESMNAGVPKGKAIKQGAANNTDFTPLEHQSAMATLHARANRIREAIKLQRIKPEHQDEVNQEFSDLQNQVNEHKQLALIKPSLKTQKAPIKKSEGSSPLSRLLKIHRGV